MRVFYAASDLPTAGHSVRAANVLVRESLLALRQLGHEVVFQPILYEAREPQLGAREEAALAWAATEGFAPLPALHAPPYESGRPAQLLRQALSPNLELFYPTLRFREEVARRAERAQADLVFHLWSPASLAACSAVEQPVFAYYGNPDHVSVEARLKNPEIFSIPRSTLRNRARIGLTMAASAGRKRAHVRLMRTCTWVGCVTAPHVDFWHRHGQPGAFYVRNMWPPADLEAIAPAGPPEQNKIAGSIGGLYGTGNSFGLFFLGREIVPALERRLGDRFTVHVYGAGSPSPAVARALDHPRLRRRGYVDDIDGELRSCAVFLLANNNNPDFLGGFTRVLHAWSLESCLVAHRNIHLAMPEVVHGENALLGGTADELADLVVQALEDADLRRRLGEAGRRTFERDFLPPIVMRRALARVEGGAGGRAARPASVTSA